MSREFEIVYELPPSQRGTYEYEREDGTTVQGDASGEWTLDENGDLEDIVFFASPRSIGLRAEGRVVLHPLTLAKCLGSGACWREARFRGCYGDDLVPTLR